jgi:hypothetical protein
MLPSFPLLPKAQIKGVMTYKISEVNYLKIFEIQLLEPVAGNKNHCGHVKEKEV